MRPLGLRLPPPRLAQHLDMPNGLGDRRFEIAEIDRLGQEIERAAVHRGADIGHVAISRDDDGRELFLALLQLLQSESPSIRGMLMSVTTISMSRLAFSVAKASTPSRANRKLTSPSRIWCRNFCRTRALQIRLVVNNQDFALVMRRVRRRVSISLRSSAEVDRLGQQRLGAALQRLAFGLRVAIGGDHDDRNVRSRSFGFRQQARGRSSPAY